MTIESGESGAVFAEGAKDLGRHGLDPKGPVHRNLSVPQLYEAALARGEGKLADLGPFVAVTSPFTGRSPNDKFFVREASSEEYIDWGKVNRPVSEEHFATLREDLVAYLNERELFVHDARAGEDPEHGIDVRLVTTKAWHALFAHNMFLRPYLDGTPIRAPRFTLLHAPDFQADPERHGTATETFIVANFKTREMLIGGTNYAGEVKKSIFTVLNYLLPGAGVLPMHCSANIGEDGDTALFFGLSGTGKTTLSADPTRGLIGDDEHGWTDHGTFNFEGGCYAKAINLSAEGEPEIHATTRMFGTVLENVIVDDYHRVPDFDDTSITENTRVSYPIDYIPNAVIPGRGGHPRNVIFLTCDAFGILPPVARLTPDQAMYHFLSGYTAKIAGTERGITEPQAAFSACFGAPFLPRHPSVYAGLLGEKLRTHGSRVWLINTGWSGGGHGVGKRISLSHTRRIVSAVLSGELDEVETVVDPVFGLAVPGAIEGIPAELLRPRDTWSDPEAYDRKAEELAGMFRKNFEQFADQVPAEVRESGPKG